MWSEEKKSVTVFEQKSKMSEVVSLTVVLLPRRSDEQQDPPPPLRCEASLTLLDLNRIFNQHYTTVEQEIDEGIKAHSWSPIESHVRFLELFGMDLVKQKIISFSNVAWTWALGPPSRNETLLSEAMQQFLISDAPFRFFNTVIRDPAGDPWQQDELVIRRKNW